MYGEKSNPYKPQRWSVPGGSLLTDDPAEVFRARVMPFSLDSIVVAAATLTGMRARDEHRFVTSMRDAGGTRATFHPTIVRRVVTRAILARELPDTAASVMLSEAFRSAEQVLMDVGSAADRLPSSDAPRSAWQAVMRVAQHNARNQLGLDTYARELWLNRSVLDRTSALNVDLEAAYRKTFGLTYSEMAMLSLAAYAEIVAEGSSGVFHREHWPLGLEVSGDQAVVNAFFDAMSLDYAEFKEWAKHPDVVEEGFEAYALSPLVRWPLIKLSDGRYVAPVASDLLDRPTRGFSVDVQQVLCSRTQADVVKDVMSSVYEEYVGDLLRAALPRATIHRGKDVLPTNRLNCDFVCVEGKLITLVEVKAAHISLKADMTKDYDVLRGEFSRRGIGKGLAQLSESARAIRERATDFPKNSVLTGLLVVRGEQAYMNSLEVRSIVEDVAAAEAKRDIFLKYQLVNDEGLALLGGLASARGGLGTLLREKLDSAVEAQADFEDFASPRLSAENTPLPLHERYRAAFRSLLMDFGVPAGQFAGEPVEAHMQDERAEGEDGCPSINPLTRDNGL